MPNRTIERLGCSVVFLSLFFTISCAGSGPLRVLSSNPRYFTDGSGKAIYLTGSETQNNFKDWGYSDPPPVFDYSRYLDFLLQHNHNFIRLWTFDQTQFVRTNDSTGAQDTAYVAPFPWLRTGPGIAQDGKPKFNLVQFDQSYFDRLRQRVVEAGARGIYVSIMLFEGNTPQSSYTALAGNPFHTANNINGIAVDQNDDGYSTEAYTLNVPAITALQDAYVKKVIDSVRDLDNVLFEICNECHAGAVEWQYHMIDLVRSYDNRRHPVGMSSDYGRNYAALYASNADWIAPSRQESGFDNLNDPKPADGQKVVIMDADHICYFDCYAGMIWKQFLRGANPIFIDLAPPLRDKAPLPDQDLIRDTMGYTKTFADKMKLAAMTPMGDLTSTNYALANPGSEYLVYAPGGGSFDVNLTAGNYNYEWFNPRSGSVTSTGSVAAAGGRQTFSPPFTGDAVLYLKIGANSPNSNP